MLLAGRRITPYQSWRIRSWCCRSWICLDHGIRRSKFKIMGWCTLSIHLFYRICISFTCRIFRKRLAWYANMGKFTIKIFRDLYWLFEWFYNPRHWTVVNFLKDRFLLFTLFCNSFLYSNITSMVVFKTKTRTSKKWTQTICKKVQRLVLDFFKLENDAPSLRWTAPEDESGRLFQGIHLDPRFYTF